MQIVENRRTGRKKNDTPKQKVLRHVGTAKHPRELPDLLALAATIMQRMEHDSSPLFSDQPFTPSSDKGQRNEDFEDVGLQSLEGEDTFVCGIPDVYGKLYDDLGLAKIFRGRHAELNNRILKNCVLARLAVPTSKLKSTAKLATHFGVRMHVDKIYRMMDQLDSDRVKDLIRRATLGIMQEKVSVLFYDVTTLHFESFTEDELHAFGFSKDCKFKETQVVVALITTTYGLPITYEVFPGDTHEVKTLLPVIEKLREKFDVASVEFAADRGLFSAANLAALDKLGITYVVGARLKSMNKATRDSILALHAQQCEGEDSYQDKESEYGGRRLVTCYNPIMAAKDRKDRARLLDRLERMAKVEGEVAVKDLVKNSGSKKYLQFGTGSKKTAKINRDKAASDAAWDGISGYITNSKQPAGKVIASYRRLWEIEEAFRISKHDLKMRPIFHRKGDRLRAHLDICFITYALVRQLMCRYRMRQGETISCENLCDTLRRTRFTLLRHIKTGELYGMPNMKASPRAKNLYRIVGLKCSSAPFKL